MTDQPAAVGGTAEPAPSAPPADQPEPGTRDMWGDRDGAEGQHRPDPGGQDQPQGCGGSRGHAGEQDQSQRGHLRDKGQDQSCKGQGGDRGCGMCKGQGPCGRTGSAPAVTTWGHLGQEMPHKGTGVMWGDRAVQKDGISSRDCALAPHTEPNTPKPCWSQEPSISLQKSINQPQGHILPQGWGQLCSRPGSGS